MLRRHPAGDHAFAAIAAANRGSGLRQGNHERQCCRMRALLAMRLFRRRRSVGSARVNERRVWAAIGACLGCTLAGALSVCRPSEEHQCK
jgi:hypothetical protein